MFILMKGTPMSGKKLLPGSRQLPFPVTQMTEAAGKLCGGFFYRNINSIHKCWTLNKPTTSPRPIP